MPILNKKDNKEIEKYNKYIQNSIYGSFTQSYEWTKIKNNWGNEIVYLEENGEIIASMLILIHEIKFGCRIMYSPRGPVCDINDIALVNRLVDEVKPLAQKYKACMLKFDPKVEYSDELNFLYRSNGYRISNKNIKSYELIQPKNEAILNLENTTYDELILTFSRTTRYNIRFAFKKGVEVYTSRKESDLKIFYNLYVITAKRDHIGYRGYDYFERLLNFYDEDHLKMFVAKHEDDYLSAAIAINYGPEMFYIYGASSNEKRNLKPNYAMQSEMIKWAIEKKCKTYNFGGIINLVPNDGLYEFKVGFCREEQIKKYIGEIDKVYNKGQYSLYRYALPVVKKIKRIIRKTKNSSE